MLVENVLGFEIIRNVRCEHRAYVGRIVSQFITRRVRVQAAFAFCRIVTITNNVNLNKRSLKTNLSKNPSSIR